MSKVDSLLIRACKSEDPIKRLESVYKRFYFHDHKYFHSAMVVILAGIIQKQELKYNLLTVLSDIDPNNLTNKMFGTVDYNEAVLNSIIHIIRFQEVKNFTNVQWPSRRHK